jgi:hypothetical protein
VVATETAVLEAIGLWWGEQEARFDKLESPGDLVDLRKELIETFRDALSSTPLLDPFAIRGIVASWWGESLPDLKALAAHGYRGLIEAWVATVLDALAEEKAKVNPLDHKVARALLPEYLDQLAALEAEVAELDSTIKAASASDDDDDAEPAEEALPTAELKKLKSKLTATKKQLKVEKAAFADRLAAASTALDDTLARQIVLDALQHELLAEAQDRIGRHRRAVISAFESWWDKYRTPLSVLEAERDAAATTLAGFLRSSGMSKPAPVIPAVADWPSRTVGELTTLLRRGTAPFYVDDSDVLAIGQRCVTDAEFDGSRARPHSPLAMAKTLRPEIGDVLINSTGTGTIGRSVIFRDSTRNYIVDGHVTVARPRQAELISRWLNDALRSPAGQRYLEARCYAGSTNQVELSSSALGEMLIMLVPVGLRAPVQDPALAVPLRAGVVRVVRRPLIARRMLPVRP